MIQNLFGDKDFFIKLIHIALPMALQSVIMMVVNLIDSVMVGKLGDIALSSVNLSSQFPYLYLTVFMGIGNAAMIIGSQAWGNNRPDKVRQMTAFCLRLCFVIAVVFFVVSFLFPRQIIQIYTNEAQIIPVGAQYLKILSVTFLFQWFVQIAVTMLRCAGVNRLGFAASLAACFANVFFNWVFIFGHLGAPAMGVAGAAVGTVIARAIEFLIVAEYMLYEKNLNFRLGNLADRIDPAMKSDFIKVGTPSIISEVTGNLNVSAAAMITGRVSAYYIAANTIVHNIWTLSSLFMFGIAMGAGVMIGHEIGARHNEKAEEYARYFINLAAVTGLAGAVLIQILAPVITGFFNVSPETLATAEQLKNAASIVIFFLAMQVVLTKGILRGGGQAQAVTRTDLISCWLVNIPAGFLAALVFHLPPFWIYLSLRIDYFIKTVWGLWRIRKGNWIIRMNVD